MFADVPGWDGYRVSDDGKVWSGKSGVWRELSPQKVGVYRNYCKVSLCDGKGSIRQKYVHHLVLLSFVGPCPDGMEAIHENDVQQDNRLTNLSWGTHKRNCQLRRSNGKDRYGANLPQAKLSEEDVTWIRKNRPAVKLKDMAKKFGVSVPTISDAATGRTWKHLPNGDR